MIASIKLLNQKQIVDNERGFDQDVMVFRRFEEKMLVVQMSIRKGVLLGKKEFSVEVQPQIEQEFLKRIIAKNRYHMKFCSINDAGVTTKKKLH